MQPESPPESPKQPPESPPDDSVIAVNFAGAAPILVPRSLLPNWHGFYRPATDADEFPDLELPDGNWVMDTTFDFAQPRTDYDRACALGGIPAAQSIAIGPGFGIVLATEMHPILWWASERMIVNGARLPDRHRLPQVAWTDEGTFRITESEWVLMNGCDHGANPDKTEHVTLQLPLGELLIQRGDYGWEDSDPALVLFRLRSVNAT